MLASKANLRAAGGRREGGLCYYNFTKLLQLLEAVLRLFVRAQDEHRAARAGLTFREKRRCSRFRMVNLDHQVISFLVLKK